MKCPVCKRETNVIDSRRKGRKGEVVRRRRMCPACGYRFTTLEGQCDDYIKTKIDVALDSIRDALYKEFGIKERIDEDVLY